MLRKLYRNTLKFSERKYAALLLSFVAFWESILFPIPPDLILIPMSLANQRRALYFATLTTVFSVFGGIVGYLIGYIFWIQIGNPLIISLGYEDSYSIFSLLFQEYGVLIVIVGALTPFPFKIIAILSGVMEYSFSLFLIAAIFSRGIRFYLIAGIIFIWGDKIDHFLQKYMGILFTSFVIVAILTYLYLK